MNTFGLRSAKFFTISSCTFGVAVAVNAMILIRLSIMVIISRNLRYSGLKSWPHSLMQCASSTATKHILIPLKKSRFSCLVSVSGATYNSFVLPALKSSFTIFICPLFKDEFRKCAILSSSL